MNILIPHSWLKDYLKTKAGPKEIAQALSLCSASVEKVKKVSNDFVYNIEITTNRIDMASVYGIAKEAAASLPRFGIKAKLKKQPPHLVKHLGNFKKAYLKVKITNSRLCSRFTVILLENIKIKPSPCWLKERLEISGIRSLNNVVDISNYVMLELGQPMHVFDYEKIRGKIMIMRESKRGEIIITLDGGKKVLPGGDIVIEDGGKRLIDLCGIMGGENSAVDEKTQKVLLFVQTYDPVRIRRTCQSLSFRTEASNRFEKGLDPEMVLPSLIQAVNLFQELTKAKIGGKIIDIYPFPYKPKRITLDPFLVEKLLGVKIKFLEIKNILQSLGFKISSINNRPPLIVTIPSFRANDINIPEDLVEEIARIYGYHNLPSVLPSGKIPTFIPNQEFYWEEKARDTLKYLGFTEIYTYSFISKSLLEKCGFDSQKCWRLSNPLGLDWEYMRPSLIPGILKTLAENQALKEKIKIFELSKVYLKKNNKPAEKTMFTAAVKGENFYKIKGDLEGLFSELGIEKIKFSPQVDENCPVGKLLHPERKASIRIKGDIGLIGEVHPEILRKFEINTKVVIFDLKFEEILKYATTAKKYIPIPKYPPIIEDLAFIVPGKTLVGEMIEEIKKVSKLIVKVKLLDSYKNTRTFRIAYQSPKKTLTDKEAEKIRKKIIQVGSKKFRASLKSA